MDYIYKIILFIVIFLSIILIHEGGHLIISKKNGIGVSEFFVGFGPVVFQKEINGTKYSLRLIPFGGACVYEGLDDEEAYASKSAFTNAPVWRRIATVAAGPIANFFLAFFLGIFLIGSIGFDAPVISEVMDGYPAKEAGIMPGDVITKLDNTRIVVYKDIRSYTMFFQGNSAKVEYLRDGQKYTTVITPKYDPESGRYLFGLIGPKEMTRANPLQVIRYSAHEVWYWIDLSYKSLGMIFQGRVTKDDVVGPVGVAQTVGDVYDESKDDGAYYVWLNMLNLTILLSSNIGVMNLLPLPALDGGRLLFLFIEVVRRKKMDQDKEAIIHFAGVVILAAFMIFIMMNDVSRFFK